MAVFSFALILILTFAFGYLNGLHGAGSVVATVISTRALSPRMALALVALCMCAGPFVLGLAVASSISVDLVSAAAITTPVVIAALAGAVAWVSLSAWLNLPCSATHAFVASLLGATWAAFGTQAILTGGLIKLLIALMVSPILGIAAGFVIVKLCYRASASASPRINRWYKAGQVLITLMVAVAFGSNDGQKLMGIVALGVAASTRNALVIPYWAAAFSITAMAAGLIIGSRRIANTLGGKLYKIEPIHGFGAQMSSGMVILSASILGGPVSGSQVIAASIAGAGSAERVRKVRWGVFRQILNTWALTLPASALAGALFCLVCTSLSL